MIGNSPYHPSKVEKRIEELMGNPQTHANKETYNSILFADVVDMMQEEFPDIEWIAQSVLNHKGTNTQCFSYVEDGHIHMIIWDWTF